MRTEPETKETQSLCFQMASNFGWFELEFLTSRRVKVIEL